MCSVPGSFEGKPETKMGATTVAFLYEYLLKQNHAAIIVCNKKKSKIDGLTKKL